MDPYQLVESSSDWERTYICAFLTFPRQAKIFAQNIIYIPAPLRHLQVQVNLIAGFKWAQHDHAANRSRTNHCGICSVCYVSLPENFNFVPLVIETGRQVARHCDRLFPPDLAAAGRLDPSVVAARLREKFTILGRKNERKRLASQLELKMRAIYYDVIDPAAVEGYIASIYEEVRAARGGVGSSWRPST